ncbi:MAG: hypothetical protein ACOCM7_00465 [Bacteroidales bacterium]
MTNQGLTVFNGFFLAAFEAGGNRPQPKGLRASKSRKALMLGVKTGGVPLGFKRSKMFFMVFIQNFLKNQINTHPLYFL